MSTIAICDLQGVQHVVHVSNLKQSRLFSSDVVQMDETIPFPWDTRDVRILIDYLNDLAKYPRRELQSPMSEEDWTTHHEYDWNMLSEIEKERGLAGLRDFYVGPVNWIDLPPLYDSCSVYLLTKMRM